MLVRFWGTRGSLPTPMWNDQIRIKARAIAKAASGQTFADDAAVEAFLDAAALLDGEHLWRRDLLPGGGTGWRRAFAL